MKSKTVQSLRDRLNDAALKENQSEDHDGRVSLPIDDVQYLLEKVISQNVQVLNVTNSGKVTVISYEGERFTFDPGTIARGGTQPGSGINRKPGEK